MVWWVVVITFWFIGDGFNALPGISMGYCLRQA
jgi:hypothetical protein